MSVARVLQAVEIFRSYNVPVTFEPGWEARGNGQSSAYEGGIVHHTGGAYNATCPGILIYGRSDLSGPLCNFAGLSGGGVHVVAAHPANHAGASGGPSNGPLPVTTLFNRVTWGLEICYPGSQSMTAEQYRTALVFAEINRRLFGDIERCRAHAETSREGKWDPGFAPGQTINMGVFRADALNIQEGEFSVSASDQVNAMFQSVSSVYARTGKDWSDILVEMDQLYGSAVNVFLGTGKDWSAVLVALYRWAESNGFAAIDGDVDEAALAARLEPALLAAASKLSDEQLDRFAQNVNDERDRRERIRLEVEA